tara:strand:+ start:867 stop:1055 length:189 start_codon:yes stop_codon:yes gene_type:complete
MEDNKKQYNKRLRKPNNSPLKDVSLSNPDSYKHLPNNPDLRKGKVLYGDFIKKANNPNLQQL